MTRKNKQPSPSLAIRFNDVEKSALRELSAQLGESQSQTLRILISEAHHILPELKTRTVIYPRRKSPGRPRNSFVNLLAKTPRTATVSGD